MTNFEYEDNIFILVKRGTCSFATKVYYGELAGASLVIIADNLNEDIDIEITDDPNGVG